MSRVRLPNRRLALNLTVPHPGPGGIVYDVAVGFDDGTPRELFISCRKITTAMHHAGLEIATLISIALQHGADLQELAAAMPREEDGAPQGAAGAVLDSVIAELGFKAAR